jgi:hypothetical protein
MAEAGGVRALLDALRISPADAGVQSAAWTALRQLGKNDECRTAIQQEPGLRDVLRNIQGGVRNSQASARAALKRVTSWARSLSRSRSH